MSAATLPAGQIEMELPFDNVAVEIHDKSLDAVETESFDEAEAAKARRRWEHENRRRDRQVHETASCCLYWYPRSRGGINWTHCHECKKPLVYKPVATKEAA